MSVRIEEGRIRLDGDCPVEDAESLLQRLQEHGSCPIDLRDCGRLHTAVIQVLFVAKRPIQGTPGNIFAAEWLLPQLPSADDRT